MQTECSAEQCEFEGFGRRRVVAAFDAGAMSSDGGGLLLRHTDRGALAAAGFFDPASNSGLWISGDYRGNDWLPADRAGQPLSSRWAGLQKRRVSNFTDTSFQVARFMTLLTKGRLVDRTSSIDMSRMMTGFGYIEEGLSQAHPRRDYSAARSKIGLGNDFSYHDCVIIRVDRDRDPKKALRYVSVVLGSLRTRAPLHQLAVGLHDCIVALH